MTTVIFLGPSMAAASAKSIYPEAIVLPPAGQGDVLSAITKYRPQIIGLIDGLFHQDLSVWHKEILFALSQGIRVVGGSSMGALRAAETHRFGMIGVGKIFGMYADGILEDDDEVALLHGSEDTAFRKLTEPMVNVRATLEFAHTEGVIDDDEIRSISGAAKRLLYTERTWQGIFEQHEKTEGRIPFETVRYITEHYVDQKLADAAEVVETTKRLSQEMQGAVEETSFTFEKSTLFEALYNRDRYVHCEGTDLPLSEIAEYAALYLPQFQRINEASLHKMLTLNLASLLSVTANTQEVDSHLRQFVSERRLENPETFDEWLKNNHFDLSELRELLHQEIICEKMRRWFLVERSYDKNVKGLLNELRLSGQYLEIAPQAALISHLSRAKIAAVDDLSSPSINLLDLAKDHLSAIPSCGMSGDLSEWAFISGFRSIDDLKIALIRSSEARKAFRLLLDKVEQ